MSNLMNAFLKEYLRKQAQEAPPLNIPETVIESPNLTSPTPDPTSLFATANALVQSLESKIGISTLSPSGQGAAEPYIDDLKDLPSLLRFLADHYVQFGGKFIVQVGKPSPTAGTPLQAEYVAYTFPLGYTGLDAAPTQGTVYIDKPALIGYLRSLQQHIAGNLTDPANRLLSLHIPQLISQANDQLKLNMSAELPSDKTPGEAAIPEGSSLVDYKQVDYKQVGYKPGTDQVFSPQQNKALQAIAPRWPLLENRIDFPLIKEWLQAYQQLPPDSSSTIAERALSSVNALLAYGVPSIDLTTDPKVEMEGIYRRMLSQPIAPPQAASLPQTFLTTASELLTDLGYLLSSFDRTYGESLPKDLRDTFRRQIGEVGSLLPMQRQKLEQMLQYSLPQVQREMGGKVL
jgi:hypothetical protein